MATLSDFGVPGGGSGHMHPKQKNKWRVTFANFGRLVPGLNTRDITLNAMNVQTPNADMDEVVIHRYNSTSYVAGKNTWSDIQLTVMDDITGLASKCLYGQYETQQRLVGTDLDGRWLNTAATGSDYKFSMKIDQLDGDEGVVATWIIEGAWIKTLNGDELSYDSADAVTFQVTIRFDHARKIHSGEGYGSALGGFSG